MMLSDFDELVKQRQELKSWWLLSKTNTRENHGGHTLRVDVMAPSLVTYCGQSHVGANNYHDAPKFFVEAVTKQIKAVAIELTRKAYEDEIVRLDAAIEGHKEAVLKELSVA